MRLAARIPDHASGRPQPRLGDRLGRGRAARRARCSNTCWPREVERKALGAEVLHLYREVNLIYGFSEKLAALLDLERVARLTLQQARHLIAATDGAIMLLDDETGALTHGRRLRRRAADASPDCAAGTASSAAIVASGDRRDRQRRGQRSAAGRPTQRP